jgi:hypothetical protein
MSYPVDPGPLKAGADAGTQISDPWLIVAVTIAAIMVGRASSPIMDRLTSVQRSAVNYKGK